MGNFDLMKHITLLALVLLVTSMFTACEEKPAYHPPLGWEKHENYVLKFTVHYPPGWILSNQGNPNLVFNITSPKVDEYDYIQENVNLIVQVVPEGTDAASYLTQLEEKATSQLVNIEKVSAGPMDFKGFDAMTSTYTAYVNDIRVKWTQYLWIKERRAYLLTYSAEITQYEAYKDFSNEIIKSLEFY